MLKNNKALSSIIAVTLLIIISVVALASFQNWFGMYSSSIYVKTESNSRVLQTNIETLIGDQLYFKNDLNENISIRQIKIGNRDCNISLNISPGVQNISLGTCVDNLILSDSIEDIVVITDKNIYEKKHFFKDIVINSPLIIQSFLQADYDMVSEGNYFQNFVLINVSSNQSIQSCSLNWNGILNSSFIINNDSCYINKSISNYGEYIFNVTVIGTNEVLNITETKILNYQDLSYGNGSDGTVLIGNLTKLSNNDGNFIVKQYENLIINSSGILMPSEPTEGMFIFVKGNCQIEGELSVSLMGKGVNDATDLYISNLTGFEDYSGELLNYKVPAIGAAGGEAIFGSSNLVGLPGENGINGQTGGGGSGGRNGHNVNCPTTYSGAGATGSSRSGGAGGGGSAADTCGATSGVNALINGTAGRGGNSQHAHGGGGGGGGNPAGVGGLGSSYYGTSQPGKSGEEGLGGILWLIVGENLIINSTGKITAKGPDGGQGGAGIYGYQGGGGGGGGGGSIHVFYKNNLNNSGIIEAPGGEGGAYYAGSPSSGYQGGNGGLGSVIGPIKLS